VPQAAELRDELVKAGIPMPEGIIDTGAGRAARVKRVKPIPEPLVRAAKTYANEARRLGASLDDAFNALCAQW